MCNLLFFDNTDHAVGRRSPLLDPSTLILRREDEEFKNNANSIKTSVFFKHNNATFLFFLLHIPE